MKKIFFFLVLLVPIIVLSQGEWNNRRSAHSGGSVLVGHFNAGTSRISDTTNFGLVDSYVRGGFGFLVTQSFAVGLELGVYKQSDVYRSQETQQQWSGYYTPYGYDYGCGCYPTTTTVEDRVNYLTYQHAGLALSLGGEGTLVRLTPGAGYFTLKYPTYDSLWNYAGDQVVARRWTYHLGLDVLKKFSKGNIFFLHGFAFQDANRGFGEGIFPVAEAGFLFPVSRDKSLQNIKLGFGGYYRSHALFGDETSVRLLLNWGGGENFLINASGFIGLAGNEDRGLRFEAGLSFGLESFARGFYE